MTGKTVVATGGGRGIGATFAGALATEAAKVVIADIIGRRQGVTTSTPSVSPAIATLIQQVGPNLTLMLVAKWVADQAAT